MGAEAAEVAAVDGAGKRPESWKGNHRSTDMKSTSANKNLARLFGLSAQWLGLVCARRFFPLLSNLRRKKLPLLPRPAARGQEL